MLKIIHSTWKEKVNGKNRALCLIECPDCNNQRTVRYDMVKNRETTICRSCINLRRPTKAPEELFDPTAYYHSKIGRIAYIYQSQKIRSNQNGWPQPAYTQQEITEWAMNQPIYHTLFQAWEDSNYLKNLSPSVDRIDDYGFYTFDNIQLMSWEENNLKGRRNQVEGINLKNCKGVSQYTLEGEYLATYHSMIEAERVTSISNASISRASRSPETSTAGGYIWRLPNSLTEPEIKTFVKQSTSV